MGADGPRDPDPAPARRVGLYGGTFDPPHAGHLAVALAVQESLDLDRVYFLPAPCPPHKGRPRTPFADRLAMVEALAGADPRLEVLDVESRLPAPHYTYRTLDHLKAGILADAQLFLIIGADSLEELHTWKHHERLFDRARLVAVTRPGHALRSEALPARLLDQVLPITRVHEDISSTGLRERLHQGEEPDGVPEPVRAVIRDRGLYPPR